MGSGENESALAEGRTSRLISMPRFAGARHRVEGAVQLSGHRDRSAGHHGDDRTVRQSLRLSVCEKNETLASRLRPQPVDIGARSNTYANCDSFLAKWRPRCRNYSDVEADGAASQIRQFKTESGFKGVEDMIPVGEKHTYSHGVTWGIVPIDNPPRSKTAMCPYISEPVGDTSTCKGRCTWSDADGDKIFTTSSRKFSATEAGSGPQTN